MIHSEPLVSVIVTAYNQQHCIDRALHNVSGQTYRNLECIVVDDGSTDATAEVVVELAERDDRIHLIRKANSGVAAARNAGFAAARGELIQFLDGDDTLEPRKLQSQIAEFDRDGSIDVSFTNHQHYFVKNDLLESFTFEPISEYPLRQFLTGWHRGVSLPVHAPLYRRSLWAADELPYPQNYHDRCEDWVFLVLLAAKGAKFAYLDQVLCTYFVYGDGFTSDIGDSCTAAIRAAQYLENKIPEKHRHGFVEGVIRRSLVRYHEANKSKVLYESKNWQLGNLLTRPFFFSGRAIRRFAQTFTSSTDNSHK